MARKLVQMKRRPRRGKKKKRQNNIVHILDHDRIIEKLSNILLSQSCLFLIKKRLKASIEKVEDVKTKKTPHSWFGSINNPNANEKKKVKEGGC